MNAALTSSEEQSVDITVVEFSCKKYSTLQLLEVMLLNEHRWPVNTNIAWPCRLVEAWALDSLDGRNWSFLQRVLESAAITVL